MQLASRVRRSLACRTRQGAPPPPVAAAAAGYGRLSPRACGAGRTSSSVRSAVRSSLAVSDGMTRATACRTSLRSVVYALHRADARIGREHARRARSTRRWRDVVERRALRQSERFRRQVTEDERRRRLFVGRGGRCRGRGVHRRRHGNRLVGRAPRHVDADATATRDARERIDLLRDAVLGDGEIVGREIDDRPSVPVAHDDVDEDRGRGRGERLRSRAADRIWPERPASLVSASAIATETGRMGFIQLTASSFQLPASSGTLGRCASCSCSWSYSTIRSMLDRDNLIGSLRRRSRAARTCRLGDRQSAGARPAGYVRSRRRAGSGIGIRATACRSAAARSRTLARARPATG